MDTATMEFEPIDKEEFSKGKALKGIEIFREGEYRGIKFTAKDLEEMASNFKSLKAEADFDPPVRIGHRGDNSVENTVSVIGYVENLYAEKNNDGKSHLYADVDITEKDIIEKIKNGTFRKRSAEIGGYDTNDGKVYKKNVIWGFGFVDIPQVEKMADVAVFDRMMDKELLEIEKEAFANKGDIKTINKAIETIKKILKEATDNDDFWRAQRSAEILGSLKNMLPMEELMEKEKIITPVDKGGDEDTAISLSKEEHIELLAAKDKADAYEKEKLEKSVEERKEKVNAFHAEAKVVTANLDKEIDFVQSLTEDQYKIYLDVKENQPAFIELDAEKGEQKSEKEAEEEAKEKERIDTAEEGVKMNLQEKGWSDEKIEEHLQKFRK